MKALIPSLAPGKFPNMLSKVLLSYNLPNSDGFSYANFVADLAKIILDMDFSATSLANS